MNKMNPLKWILLAFTGILIVVAISASIIFGINRLPEEVKADFRIPVLGKTAVTSGDLAKKDAEIARLTAALEAEKKAKGDTPPADAKGKDAATSAVDFSKFAEADLEEMGATCDPKTGGDGNGGLTVRVIATEKVLCKPL